MGNRILAVGLVIVMIIAAVFVYVTVNQNQTISTLQQQLAAQASPEASAPSVPAPAAPASAEPNVDNSQQNPSQTVNITVNGSCVTCDANGSPCSSQSPAPSAPDNTEPSVAPSSAPEQPGCPAGEWHVRAPKLGKAWHPTEPGWIVMQGWSNQTNPNWPATGGTWYIIVYGPNNRPDAFVGGSYWVWQDKGCMEADLPTQVTEGNIIYNLSGEDIKVPDGWVVKTSLPSVYQK